MRMCNDKRGVRLTEDLLQQLKDRGFRYVLIKGYSLSKKMDWIELNAFQLTPVKALPEDPAEKEIYAPVDSEILSEWASPENKIQAFIAMP
jgi:hypothetical protein